MTQQLPQTARVLLDVAVARLALTARTFTDQDALGELWHAGYDISPQSDARFALAREADGRAPRHWRLANQVVANNLLLDALLIGTWDGCGLDSELRRLSDSESAPCVFCPIDPRFVVRTDGALEPADREEEVILPPETRAELDALREPLLLRWREEGGEPRTVRRLTEMLGELELAAGEAKGRLAASARPGWVPRTGSLVWAATTGVPSDRCACRAEPDSPAGSPGRRPRRVVKPRKRAPGRQAAPNLEAPAKHLRKPRQRCLSR